MIIHTSPNTKLENTIHQIAFPYFNGNFPLDKIILSLLFNLVKNVFNERLKLTTNISGIPNVLSEEIFLIRHKSEFSEQFKF